MAIKTKELVISEELKRKIEMICRFTYVEYELINGNIKSIKNINIATVKLHIVKIKSIDYLIFDDFDEIFINGKRTKHPTYYENDGKSLISCSISTHECTIAE